MRFVKLHRGKECPAPYLPAVGQPRRSSPHAAPCHGDADAAYCKFNYLKVGAYQHLLECNLRELQQQQQQFIGTSSNSSTPLEAMCLSMAMQVVQQEWNRSMEDAAAEMALQQQFQNPAAGLYQAQQQQQQHLVQANAGTIPTDDTIAAYDGTASWDDRSAPNRGQGLETLAIAAAEVHLGAILQANAPVAAHPRHDLGHPRDIHDV